ncbi:MAG: ATP-binding protein [Acidimicrobiales bacterium]
MSAGSGKRTISGRLSRTLGLLVALMLASAAVGIGSLTLVITTRDTIVQRYDPLRLSNARIFVDLANAEVGVRGYLLTGKKSFLQPYAAGIAAYPHDYQSSVALAAGDPATLLLLNRSRSAADAWLHRYAEPIAAGPGGPNATSAAETTQGMSLFESFRLANLAVDHSVGRMLDQARKRASMIQDLALGILTAIAVLGIGTGIMVAAKVNRSISRSLQVVRNTMHELAGGDTGARAPPAEFVEIQAVSNSLNRLADEAEASRTASAERTWMSRLAIQVSRQIRNELGDRAVLDQAVANLGTALHADRVLIRITDGDDQAGVLAAQWAAEGTGPLLAANRLAGSINESADFWSDVSGTLVIEDCATVPYAEPGIRADWEAGGVGSLVRQMLWDGSELMGTVLITAGTKRSWSEGEVELVRVVAGDLARALTHARMYSHQQQLVAKLRELDDAKTAFIGTLSHESVTLQTSIAGYVELVRDGSAGTTTPAGDRMLGTILRNTDRLRSLTDDLRTLSLIESGSPSTTRERVVLGDLVGSVQAVLGPVARQRDITLRCEPGDPAARVWGDPIQLERALLNLAANAVKFTPDGGEVTVRVDHEGPDSLLVIADTGIGIPTDEQEAVFGQFHRASNANAGVTAGTGLGLGLGPGLGLDLGLGLAISRGIVERHGGTLTLDSEVGVGTTVTVRIPQDARDARAGQRAGARSEEVVRSQGVGGTRG